MLKTLFHKQKTSLEHFFNHFNLEQCQKIIDDCASCSGVLFLTGVGKSGFIGQKIAATLMSTGTRAFFLPPLDALHGDLGMVHAEDIVLVLSKSGQTDTLLQLLPALRVKGPKILCATSSLNSPLARGCDASVELPCSYELCPFDLAPTTSTQLQLLFGDLLSINLMQLRGISLDDYAKNHPGGSIGRRAHLKVRDLMLIENHLPLCAPTDLLADVLLNFSNKRCGCLLVIDEQQHLKGIFTDGDLRRALQEKQENVLRQKVGDLMTLCPRTIHAEALAWEAMKLMESDPERPVTVLPVLRPGNAVVGLIKMHDIIQAGL